MKQEQDGQYQFKEKQIKKIVEQNLHPLENFPKNYIFTSKTWNLFFCYILIAMTTTGKFSQFSKITILIFSQKVFFLATFIIIGIFQAASPVKILAKIETFLCQK